MKKVAKTLLILGISSIFVFNSCSNYKNAKPLFVYAIEQTGNYGDGTLFKYGDFEILIDAGNPTSSDALKEILNKTVNDNKVEIVISSHPHNDHFGGLISNTSRNTFVEVGIDSVENIVDSGCDGYGYQYSNEWIGNFRTYFVNKGAKYTPIQHIVENKRQIVTWKIDKYLSIDFLNTNSYATLGSRGAADANQNSIACIVRYQKYNFFMFGDLPSESEQGILNYSRHSLYSRGDFNIFKACHHGSAGANSRDLINHLKPQFGWASSGIIRENSGSIGIQKAQHPYYSARERIMESTGEDNFYWNALTGTLEMKIENGNFSVQGLGRKYGQYYYKGELVDSNLEKDLPFYKTKWAQTLY